LAVLARAPGSTQVVLRRLDEVRGVSARPPDGSESLDIRKFDATAQDPDGAGSYRAAFAGVIRNDRQPGQGISSKAEIGVKLCC